MTPLLNVLIGTRGQFVKMAPVLREMDRQGMPYRVINTGQHTHSTARMASLFGIPKGHVYLTKRQKDITRIREAASWFVHCIRAGSTLSKAERRCKLNMILTHGDTLSTLVALALARFWKQHLAHVESGLTSNSFWIPFPEEMTRRLVVSRASLLFAPNSWASENLKKCSVKGKIISTQANTVLDAIRMVAAKGPPTKGEPYGVVTMHRNETFYSRKNAQAALASILCLPRHLKIKFVVHRLTQERLRKYKLWPDVCDHPHIELLDYLSYDRFMQLVAGARFVMTDGGGLQEETYYLNVPCLVMRKKTERQEGLGANAMMGKMNPETVKAFIAQLSHFRHGNTFDSLRPSEVIANTLKEMSRGAS